MLYISAPVELSLPYLNSIGFRLPFSFGYFKSGTLVIYWMCERERKAITCIK